jgi:hypothetical protein
MLPRTCRVMVLSYESSSEVINLRENRMRRLFVILSFAAAGLSLCATQASAETIYGTDDLNGLFTFDSANASAATRVAITGLQSGETLVGIDVRSASGVLYGIGSTNRVYTINIDTGAASQVGTAGALAARVSA